MPVGLGISDANGNVIFDDTTSIIKILGYLSIGNSYTGSQQSGSVTDARFTQYPGSTSFWAAIDGTFTVDGYTAIVTISGNVLNWSYPINDPFFINGAYLARPNMTLIYGIY